MKMNQKTAKAEKYARVEQVMNEVITLNIVFLIKKLLIIYLKLNLKKCENTLIGIPDKDVKGISGGERRRLAFACELITNPNLLFFDEPTSGLDSFMAMSIVDAMRSMANQGKTIICTIHQPSSEIFEKFDRLCLLAEGRLAYIGNLNEANGFFGSQGFNVPNNYNPADFYINTLAIVPSNKDESKAKVEVRYFLYLFILANLNLIFFFKKICDYFSESQFNSKLNEEIKNANVLASNPKYDIKLSSKIR